MRHQGSQHAPPLQLGKNLRLHFAELDPTARSFLVDRRVWLRGVARELRSWRFEADSRDYQATVNRYFYVYAVAPIEAMVGTPRIAACRDMVEAQFWLCLHARFIDDVLDNDHGGVGFETAAFLAMLSWDRARDAFGRQERWEWGDQEFWKLYAKMFTFHMECTRAGPSTSASTFIQRQWQRGSVLFVLPSHIRQQHRSLGTKDRSVQRAFLRAYFDLTLAASDARDLLADMQHNLNTPMVLIFREARDCTLVGRAAAAITEYRSWVDRRYLTVKRYAASHDLQYTSAIAAALYQEVLDVLGEARL